MAFIASTFGIDQEKKHWEEDRRREIERLTAEHELKLREAITLARLSSEQNIKQIELNAERKYNERAKELNEEYYEKLATAMSKLHEEGNVTTKFIQDLALKMMGSLPSQKTVTKVLTGSAKEE